MTRKPTHSSRPTPLLAVIAIAAIAMLALAGPVSAHDGGGDGKRHGDHGKRHGKHKKRGHKKKLNGDSGGAAGVIASFDPASGRLVLTLSDGDTVGGLVTEFTAIEDGDGCDHHGDHDWSGKDGDWGHDRRQLTGWDHDDWDDDDRGSTDDLVAGAVVDDAVLLVKDGKAAWLKIELEDDDSSHDS